MIKNFIYIIGFLMFLSGPLYPLIGHANESASTAGSKYSDCSFASDPSCKINSRIGYALNKSEYAVRSAENEGLDFGNSFGEDDLEDIGQDLYITIYDDLNSETMDSAIQATADQYGMPVERMTLIIGGDISPILERNPMLSIERTTEIYNDIVNTYKEKKNSVDLEATINARVLPSEIFADGDLSNSGFDLINDLNNIEIILFQRAETVTFGGNYSGGDGSGEENTDEVDNSQDNIADIPIDLSGGLPSGNNSQTGAGATANTKNPFELNEDKSAIFTGTINPNSCFADGNLDDALEKFGNEQASNEKLKSNVKNETKSQTNTSGSNGSANLNDLDVNVPTVTSGDQLEQISPAPPADYTVEPICDDILCIDLKFVKKHAVAQYKKTDNCIECHVEYINESLKKTISHSLIPGKATGNYGESTSCKAAAGDALGSIGMNVSIQIVPVVTPVKQDLMNMSNFDFKAGGWAGFTLVSKEWDNYASKNGFWNYNKTKERELKANAKGTERDLTPIINDTERMLQVNFMDAPDNATSPELMEKTAKDYVDQKALETKQMLVAEYAKDAYQEVNGYQALNDEMQAMNTHFLGLQKAFRTLLEDVPGMNSSMACVKLNEKKACQ